jgi:hypothetical protein
MKPIECLLVGGRSHGEIHAVRLGNRMAAGGQSYQGENYLHNGRLYRIAKCVSDTPTVEQLGEVPTLIDENRLKAIA